MDKHIAFVSVPAFGHVNPTLGLVHELTRRGYRITYATGEQLLPSVAAAGARALPIRLSGMPAQTPSGADFTLDALVPLMQRFLREVRESFPPLLAHFEQDRPAAVCFDVTTFPGQMLAEKLGVLDVSLFPFMASNETFGLQDMMKHESFSPDNPLLIEFGREIGAFAAQYGLTFAPQAYGGKPATLNLVFLDRELQIAGDTFDERFHFLGPQLRGRAESGWTPPAGDRPVLFVTLGTIFNERPDFFRTCLDAFGDTEWHVVMSTGDRTDQTALGPVPKNVELFRYAPQLAVLRHARLAVVGGGMNGIAESLGSGTPIVIAPQQPEQDTNARRIEELRLGRGLGMPEVTVESLRAAVHEVDTDPEIRANVARMTERADGFDGARAGADAIEAALAARPSAG